MNALKHGLRAESVVLVGEEQEQFLALLEKAFKYFEPRNFLEEHFVEEIAVNIWKLRRCRQMEVDLFAMATKLQKQQIQAENRNTNPPRPASVSPAAALAYIIKEGDYLTLSHLSRYEAQARRSLFNAFKELDRIIQRENAAALGQKSISTVPPKSSASSI